jgi:hypothetical protein
VSGAAIAGTLGAPAASAMPIDPVGAGGERPGEPYGWNAPTAVETDVPTAVETAPEAGFDLSSATIGAAAGGLLVVILAGGTLAWRRPITRGHRAAGA